MFDFVWFSVVNINHGVLTMTNTVLILGASGKVGSHAADAFSNAGWTVRRYERGTDMSAAAVGADVIVNGLNPPNYNDWANSLPAITQQVIAAAKASGASVILPGNVYNFGQQSGVYDENTPQVATTRKGKIRVRIEQMYRTSGVQTIVLRGGNFIDPRGNGDIMSALVARNIAKGKLSSAGDPNIPLSYCYVPDLARGMQMLAERRESLSSFEDVPFPGHTFSITELQRELSSALNRPVKVGGFPWWLMHIAAPFWELARELIEMRYLWNTPHRLSSEKFERLLPEFEATPQERVMRAALPQNVDPDQTMRSDRQTILSE